MAEQEENQFLQEESLHVVGEPEVETVGVDHEELAAASLEVVEPVVQEEHADRLVVGQVDEEEAAGPSVETSETSIDSVAVLNPSNGAQLESGVTAAGAAVADADAAADVAAALANLS